MSMLYIAAAAALTFAPPSAGAAPAEGPEALVAVAPPQQGKGGGGGKQAQGGGNGGGRQQEARGGGQGREREQPRLQRQETRRETRGRSAERERSSRPAQSRAQRERLADDARGGGSERRRSETTIPRGSGERRREEARGSGSGNARGAGSAEARGRGSSDAVARKVSETRGRSSSAAARGPGRLSSDRVRERINALPANVRRFAGSSRASERMAVGALALGAMHGLASDAVFVRSDNDRVRLLNRRNELLLDLDDRRARDLGFWELRRLGDRQPRAGAPAFCRSGEGHPVWGREWCLDKGFGLGSRPGFLWSRGIVDDVYYRPYYGRDRLDRGGLIGVLGDIIFSRLALHALSLGFDQPLGGMWVADPGAPRILRVYSGDGQVAEFVDLDRDDRVEVLYVAQPVWY